MSDATAVLVLAGGRSRRMGRDKATLRVAGEPLLRWQTRRLAALGVPVFQSGPDGIPDGHSDFRGPLAGIEAAARAHPEIRLWLVVPVDMPRVRPATLQALIDTARQRTVPIAYRDHPLPLALPMTPDLAQRLARWLADPEGPRTIRHLHRTGAGDWLPVPADPDDLMNLNTPEEWRRFLANGRLPAGDSA